MFYANFIRLCNKRGKPPSAVAVELGFKKSTVTRWKNGSNPTDSNAQKIADYFGVTLDELREESAIPAAGQENLPLAEETASYNSEHVTSSELKMIKKYRALDEHGKRMVQYAIEEETARMQAERKQPEQEMEKTKIIPLFGNSFAAGPAEPDFGNMWEDYAVPAGSPADFAIKINGDSMEPYLPDGSIALGRKGTPQDGDIVALFIDSGYVCKQICQDNFGNIYLFSLNRARADADITLWHNEEHRFQYYGKILMEKRLPLPREER